MLPSDLALSIAQERVKPVWYVVASAQRVNQRPVAVFVAGVDAADRVTVYGDCQFDSFTKPLRLFSAAQGMSQSSVLEALVEHPDGHVARQFYAAASPSSNGGLLWSDTDPSERNVDPDDTPESIMKSLQSQAVFVAVPQSWLPTSWLLCTRSAEGWGDCSEISAAAAGIDAKDAGDQVTLHAIVYFDRGSGYDVLLRNGPAFDDPTKPLISVAAETASKEGRIHLTITGTIGSPSIKIVDG